MKHRLPVTLCRCRGFSGVGLEWVLGCEQKPAEPKDTADVMQLIALCIEHMRANGIYQWDEIYPDLHAVEEDAQTQSLFVIRQEGLCLAAVSLNDVQPDEYRTVKWRCGNGRALVVHRLCVHPERQGRGIGRELMGFAEYFAYSRGFSSIRLDAYSGNPQALALYERRGYQRGGQLYFPRRELPFDCFEKVLPK